MKLLILLSSLFMIATIKAQSDTLTIQQRTDSIAAAQRIFQDSVWRSTVQSAIMIDSLGFSGIADSLDFIILNSAYPSIFNSAGRTGVWYYQNVTDSLERQKIFQNFYAAFRKLN